MEQEESVEEESKREGRNERETEREKKKKIPVWTKKWKGERKEVQKKKLLFSSLSAPATLTNQSQIMSSTSLGWIVIAKNKRTMEQLQVLILFGP